ncbi:MAPEG family protein [Sphingomonas glacialis]|uniref:MAPEG family protein n=1 Tax=Sphingomonas glacialis TaxID=658225 RepID=A0A502FRY5_9SPHN|nr:MAPEG family protein [Sphingomonas glacialis]
MPIALVTAGAAAILNLWLAMRTGAIRRQTKISVGDGGNEALIRRMRAHANFIESAPFIVILIALIEFTTGTSLWLWVASALFLLARVAHPLGMDGVRIGREAGTLVTFALLLGLGGYAATLPFMAPAVHGTPAVSAAPAG